MSKGVIVPMPADAPNAGEVFRHYKGDRYQVVGMALNSGDAYSGKDEWMVVYRPLYEQPAASLFTRPLSEWVEMVDYQGQKLPRFTKL